MRKDTPEDAPARRLADFMLTDAGQRCVENAGYGPTICAERTAFAKAVSEGCREFLMIASAGGREEEECAGPCAPCGVCRQVMREFCDPDSFLILMGRDGEILAERTLSELLPMSFGPNDLKGRNIL